jgi:hypothetical protein
VAGSVIVHVPRAREGMDGSVAGRFRGVAPVVALIVCFAVVATGTWSGAVALPWREPDVPAGVDAHLREIASVPHAVGTPAADDVRGYIVGQLERHGLTPEIQVVTLAAADVPGVSYRVARVRNVLARVRGSASTGAALIAAHYDSARFSAGAGDNAVGVAGVLEAAAAAASRPPRNDTIFLFADAEEVGIFGARAFVDHHRWTKDVRAVVNFDARGTTGPPMLIEHGREDGWTVRAFGRSVARPFGSSLVPLLYRRLPNYTDFNALKEIAAAGLNLAFFGGGDAYHTPRDLPEHLSRRTVAHQVSNATALSRELGASDFGATLSANVVYFDLIGLYLVVYGRLVAFAIGVLVVGAGAWAVVRASRREQLTVAGVIVGLLALPSAAAIAGGALTWLAPWLPRVHGSSAIANDLSVWILCAIVVLITWCVYAPLTRRVPTAGVVAGTVIWWSAAALYTSVLVPDASYVFVWPAAGAVFILWLLIRAPSRASLDAPGYTALLVAALPLCLILAPLITAVNLVWPFSGMVAAFVAAALAILVPALQRLSRWRRGRTPALLALVTAFLWGVAVWHGSTARRAQPPESLAYILDGHTGTAVWMTDPRVLHAGRGPGGHARDLPVELAGLREWYRFVRFVGTFTAAPSDAVAAPTILLVENHRRGGHRFLRILLRSPRRAPEMSVHLTTTASIALTSVDGLSLADAPLAWERGRRGRSGPAPAGSRSVTVTYFAPAAEGVVIDVKLDAEAGLTVQLVDRAYDIPASLIDTWPAAGGGAWQGTSLATRVATF